MRNINLETKKYACPKCKKLFPINRPVCFDGYIGFKSESHESCPFMVGLILTPKSKEKKGFWKQII